MSQLSFGVAVVVADAVASAYFVDTTNAYSVALLFAASAVSLIPLAVKFADGWIGGEEQ